MPYQPKVSIEPLPPVTPELAILRDALQRNLEKLEQMANTRSLPVGAIAGNPTSNVWDGWLICDGSLFDTVKYRELFEFLGTNVTPDLRGRTVVGLDATQTEFDTIGEVGGSKTATAAHTHTVDHDHGAVTSGGHSADHAHTVGSHNHGGGTGVHAHLVNGHWLEDGGGDVPGTNRWRMAVGAPTNRPGTDSVGVATAFESPGTTGASANHSHDIDLPNFAGTSGGSSTGAASGNLMPYKVANWMIKT